MISFWVGNFDWPYLPNYLADFLQLLHRHWPNEYLGEPILRFGLMLHFLGFWPKKVRFFLGWFFIKKVASEEVHHIGLGAQNLRWSRAFLWSKSMPILVPIKWVVFEKFRFELNKCCILGFFWPFFGYLGGFISEKFALVTYFRYGLLSHSILGATPRNGTKKICLV